MNKSDLIRNAAMPEGALAKQGFMRWWHSFCGISLETGERRTFFIEYIILNPSLGRTEPVLGQLPFHKKNGIKPSYICIKVGVMPGTDDFSGKQLHGFYPITSLKSAANPFILQVENNFYSENRISGTVTVSPAEAKHRSYMCDAGSMEWDLEVHKVIACHIGSTALEHFWNRRGSFWHGEGIKTHYRGNVTLDGVPYQVIPENCFGYADKHWGRCFHRPWLQFSSCHLISEATGRVLRHSALVAKESCKSFLCFPLKHKLLLQLTYEGEDFEFHISRQRSHVKWHIRRTAKRLIWQLVAQNSTAILKMNGNCLLSEMMPLYYESPEGPLPAHPLLGSGSGTGTALLYRKTDQGKELIDTFTIANIFCEYGER